MEIFVSLVFFLIAGTLSFTEAQQPDINKDEILKQYPELAKIPGLAEFNTSSIKVEDVEKVLRDKCNKVGGPTAFDNAKNAPIYLNNCLQSLVNVTQLQNEMKEARPQGNLDEVFQKYCRKVPKVESCVKNVTDTIEPCLETKERDGVKTIHNITSSLLAFICHNEGDRIAMFIAANGIECFKAKQVAVQKCANSTFGSYVSAANKNVSAMLTPASIPFLVLGLKECQDIEKFRTCAVNVLEQCEDPTPANVVESLFNFVKRATPCEDALKAEAAASTSSNAGSNTGDNRSSGTINVINILLITTAMALSLRFV